MPVPQLRNYQKIQTRLVRELEKKFSGKHVVFIAQVCKLLSLKNDGDESGGWNFWWCSPDKKG